MPWMVSQAAFASSTLEITEPDMASASNWLGVTMSAKVTALCEMNSGMPSATKKPRP